MKEIAEKKQLLYESILAELSSEQAKTNFSLAYEKLKLFAERQKELCPLSEEVKTLMTELKSLTKEDFEKEGKTKKSKPKPDDIYGLKFTSIDSWVRFDPDLFAIQKTPLREKDEVPRKKYNG